MTELDKALAGVPVEARPQAIKAWIRSAWEQHRTLLDDIARSGDPLHEFYNEELRRIITVARQALTSGLLDEAPAVHVRGQCQLLANLHMPRAVATFRYKAKSRKINE